MSLVTFLPVRRWRASGQLLCGNHSVPVAVLNDLVAVSNDDFTFADSDIGRVKLIERAALDGDCGIGAVLAVQRPSWADALEGASLDGDLRTTICINQGQLGTCGSLICKFAALDDNLGALGGVDGHRRVR